MKLLYKLLLLCALFFIQTSCTKNIEENNTVVIQPVVSDDFIRAADVSFLPEIENANIVFYNHLNQPEKILVTLKKAGCNFIRIRLWHNPLNGNSGMQEVKALVAKVKSEGMKVWITVHFSDTWADPGTQTKPAAWTNLSFSDLKTALENYTSTILTELNPDIIQIGNEINDGFLWPSGQLTSNQNQFLELLKVASDKIRIQSPNTKIMLHYAGINGGASWFFDKVKTINYNYIGLSYYPMYHGKSLTDVKNTINFLGNLYNKKVIIAETSYPFTFGYNDWTNNIIGLPSQIIEDYPPTPEGQKQFMLTLRSTISQSTFGAGFAYWGTEWVSFKGNQATNGSSYENQAMWDFANKVLPAIEVFKK